MYGRLARKAARARSRMIDRKPPPKLNITNNPITSKQELVNDNIILVQEEDDLPLVAKCLTCFLLLSVIGCCYAAYFNPSARVVLVASLSLIALAIVVDNDSSNSISIDSQPQKSHEPDIPMDIIPWRCVTVCLHCSTYKQFNTGKSAL